MKYTVLLSLLFISLFSCVREQKNPVVQSEKTAPVAAVQYIDGPTLRTKITNGEDLQIIDVRTPAEFSTGAIPSAINLNIRQADFRDQLQALDRSKPTVVYCQAGGRSARAAKLMRSMGFQELYDLKGGMNAIQK